MDHDNDGAINLSTSQRPSACTTPNGSTDFEDADQVGELDFFRNLYGYATCCADEKRRLHSHFSIPL